MQNNVWGRPSCLISSQLQDLVVEATTFFKIVNKVLVLKISNLTIAMIRFLQMIEHRTILYSSIEPRNGP